MELEGWKQRFNEVLADNQYWMEFVEALLIELSDSSDVRISDYGSVDDKKIPLEKLYSIYNSIFPGLQQHGRAAEFTRDIKGQQNWIYNRVGLDKGNNVQQIGKVKVKFASSVALCSRSLKRYRDTDGDLVGTNKVLGYDKRVAAIGGKTTTSIKIMGNMRKAAVTTPGKKLIGLDFRETGEVENLEILRKYVHASYGEGKLESIGTSNKGFLDKKNGGSESYKVVRADVLINADSKVGGTENLKLSDED